MEIILIVLCFLFFAYVGSYVTVYGIKPLPDHFLNLKYILNSLTNEIILPINNDGLSFISKSGTKYFIFAKYHWFHYNHITDTYSRGLIPIWSKKHDEIEKIYLALMEEKCNELMIKLKDSLRELNENLERIKSEETGIDNFNDEEYLPYK